jgi:hypothetical protein
MTKMGLLAGLAIVALAVLFLRGHSTTEKLALPGEGFGAARPVLAPEAPPASVLGRQLGVPVITEAAPRLELGRRYSVSLRFGQGAGGDVFGGTAALSAPIAFRITNDLAQTPPSATATGLNAAATVGADANGVEASATR